MFPRLFVRLRNLPIRYKLLLTYSVIFVVLVTTGGAFSYSVVRRAVERGIESELRNSTATLLHLVRTSVTSSIRNYLRAIAFRNLEITEHFYERYRAGELSEEEAMARAGEVILSQKIGSTGYVCCLDSQGLVLVHPKTPLLRTNLSEYGFVQELKQRKEGYLEYEWQNPEDEAPQPKAMFMTHFAPWDWIIIASSYRDEFLELVNVDDFKESVLSLTFGQSGYSYVADRHGNAVIHPKFQGSNIYGQQAVPSEFFSEMLESRSGKIVYSWKNPGEATARKKLVLFNHIPEFDWIVASSSYLEEVYAPLIEVRNWFVLAMLGALVLVLPVTLRLSSSITNPLRRLMRRLSQEAAGDLGLRAEPGSGDEVGQLALYFDAFLARLQEYGASLRGEIAERKQAEEALRESEERYRSVMEAAPDPIAVYDMEGRVVYFNPAFTRVFGWELTGCLGKKMDAFVPEECWPETRRGIERVLAGQTIAGVETRRYTRGGATIHVAISGATYRDRNGALSGSVMILRDTTDQVAAQRALRLSEEMLSKAFSLSPNAIAIATLKDRRLLNVNDTFLRLTGYEREEALGKTPRELQLFFGIREGQRLLSELVRHGRVRGREVPFRTRFGERRLGRVSADLIEIRDEPCLLATTEDITDWRRLEREVIESGDRERRRIGQELHDDLGPHLIGIEVLGKVLQRKLEHPPREEAAYARRIRDLISEATQKTRALARGLCPVHLADTGLAFAMQELAENTRSIYGFSCALRTSGEVRVEDNSVATELFYIAREAVHNAVKHSRGATIAIDLEERDGRLLLAVSDDGVGMPEGAGSIGKGGKRGMGLRIMGYRARMIGAALETASRPGQGTRVSVTVPLEVCLAAAVPAPAPLEARA